MANPMIRGILYMAGVLFGAIPVASAEPRSLDLPQMTAWCERVEVEASRADDEAATDAARDSALSHIDSALLSAGVAHSGMPFVTRVSARPAARPSRGAASQGGDEEAAGELGFDVCVPAPADTPSPPRGISVATVPAGRYALIVCGSEIGDACLARLNETLSELGIAADATLRPEVMSTLTARDESDVALAEAFAAAADRATERGVTVTVTGEVAPPLSEDDERPRPLRLDPSTARITAGLPPLGIAAVAVRLPARPEQ